MLRFSKSPRSSRVPASYTATLRRDALGVEVYADPTGCVVMGFSAKRQKPDFHFQFKAKERADLCVSQWLEKLEQRAQRKADERAARVPATNLLQVGDVLRASWGYEQTNIDYYEVTRLVGRLSVEVREIACESEDDGNMTGTCVPIPGAFIGQPFIRRVIDGSSVKVSGSRVYARKKESRVIGELRTFAPDRWTAYA